MDSERLRIFLENYDRGIATEGQLNEFKATLGSFQEIAETESEKQIRENHAALVKDVTMILNHPRICREREVADQISGILLAMMVPSDRMPSEGASKWASWVLMLNLRLSETNKKKNASNSSKSRFDKEEIWEAILKYPNLFISRLDDHSLVSLASNHPPELFTRMIEEIEERNLTVTDEMLMKIEVEQTTSPSLVLKYFLLFVETPTLEIAFRLFKAFERLPPLHLVCVNESLKRFGQTARRALEQIGTAFKKYLEKPSIGLEFFYHPAIKEFVKVVERTRANPGASNEMEIIELIQDIKRKELQFLVPLMIEFPDLFEYMFGLDSCGSPKPFKFLSVVEMIANL
jgi:hypothetical protein